MDRPEWAPEGIDVSRPSNARVYDYFLGGAHNLTVDRELAEQILRTSPGIGETMRANRAFLRRAVRFLVGEGITQFLDIGSGIPTVGNVHEVAGAASDEARVVYVDMDPVAVAHSEAILAGDPRTAIVHADAREPGKVLAAAQATGLLDLTRPVAVLLLGVVHFMGDADDPPGVLRTLREAVPAGSYLALSHVTTDNQPPEVVRAFELSKRTPEPIIPRTHAEIEALFGDFALVEPGLVDIPRWRPDEESEAARRSNAYAGVARKP